MSEGLYRKRVRSGDFELLVSEIETGAHKGSYRVQGREDGAWQVFGIYKDQKKAIAKARAKLRELDYHDKRLLKLSKDEADFCLQALDSGMSIDDVKRFQQRKDDVVGITLVEALDEWISSQEKQSYSTSHMTDMKFLRRVLPDALGEDREVAHIDNHDLSEWFNSLTQGAKRRKNIRGVCVSFWKWLHMSKNYTKENFAQMIEVPRIIKKSSHHQVLTPCEFAALLENCPDEYIPWLTISGFAGLRSSEICGASGKMDCRLRWDDFDWTNNRVSVRPETSKTGFQRYTPICNALAEWLEPWKKSSGFVHTTYAPQFVDRKKGSVTQKLGELIGGWRANCLRASRASYRLAQTNNLSLTALEDGHSEAILRKNYLNPRFSEDAELWFSLTPDKVQEINNTRIIEIKKSV